MKTTRRRLLQALGVLPALALPIHVHLWERAPDFLGWRCRCSAELSEKELGR